MTVLWPHPWLSFLKCSHSPHKHASWKHGQCSRRKFSFLLHKKTIFHFPSAKNRFFVKDQPQICCKNLEMHYLKTLYHVRCTNHQIVGSEKVSMHLFWKWQIPIDSVGNGSNLNYRCLVGCSWFLAKKSFLGTQLPISSEIRQEFLKIQSLAMHVMPAVLTFSWNSA